MTPKLGNGNTGISIAALVLITLLSLVLYVIGGYKTEVADARMETKEVEKKVSDHGERIKVLESQWPTAVASLDRIERKLDKHMERENNK